MAVTAGRRIGQCTNPAAAISRVLARAPIKLPASGHEAMDRQHLAAASASSSEVAARTASDRKEYPAWKGAAPQTPDDAER